MRQFIDALVVNPDANVSAAAGDTRFRMAAIFSGSAAKMLAARLRRAQVQLIAPPESFFVTRGEPRLEPGEMDRAATWASGLAERLSMAQRRIA